jgi:uncharacterized protein YndB with AHSA1/START domain
MSVKKEESGRRSVQVEVEVPGTPEAVWKAIATGPGISAWFVPAEVDEREGGMITCHFGPGMDSTSTIKTWEPPHRFADGGSALGPDAPALATEWIVEARSGGVCVVRVVHSLFASTDEWDDQLTSVESGWPAFFRILRLYLTHFPGQPSSTFQVSGIAQGPASEAWDALTSSLGLEGAALGQRRQTAAGAPVLNGVVEAVREGEHPFTLLLLDEPVPGAAFLGACPMGAQTFMSMSFYLYGDEAAATVLRIEPIWQAWINAQLPPAAETSPEPLTSAGSSAS